MSNSINDDAQPVAILKAQLEAEKEHNAQIIETVYWSISFVGGLALLLLGASWFNTRVVHDRELKSILRQLSAEQSEGFSQMREQITSELSALIDKDVSAKLTHEMEAIKRSLSSLTSSMRSNKLDIKILEHTSEIRYWRSRDVPANVLMQYRLMLQDVKAAKDEYHTSEALAGIQKLLEEGASVDPDEIPDFMAAVSDLPDHFSVNVHTIRQLLAQRRG